MEISSYVFILLFFPFVLVSFYILLHIRKTKAAYILLLAASLVFYGVNSRQFIGLFLADILINFAFAKAVCKCAKDIRAKILMAAAIVCDVGFLAWFKYYNLATDTSNLLFGTDFLSKEIVLPLGISFICFQQIAFLAEAYRGDCPKTSASLLTERIS